jgi:hypothetical protein
LATLVVHSTALVATVELTGAGPPQDSVQRCDEVLVAGGRCRGCGRWWEAERLADRQVLPGVRLVDLRASMLRLARPAASTHRMPSIRALAQSIPAE